MKPDHFVQWELRVLIWYQLKRSVALRTIKRHPKMALFSWCARVKNKEKEGKRRRGKKRKEGKRRKKKEKKREKKKKEEGKEGRTEGERGEMGDAAATCPTPVQRGAPQRSAVLSFALSVCTKPGNEWNYRYWCTVSLSGTDLTYNMRLLMLVSSAFVLAYISVLPYYICICDTLRLGRLPVTCWLKITTPFDYPIYTPFPGSVPVVPDSNKRIQPKETLPIGWVLAASPFPVSCCGCCLELLLPLLPLPPPTLPKPPTAPPIAVLLLMPNGI